MRPRTALMVTALICACSASHPTPASAPVVEARTQRDDGPETSTNDAGAASEVAPNRDAGSDAPALGAEAGRFYREALAAAERNDFASAARLFASAYEASPSPEMAFNAFRMCERSASVDEAARWYERIVSHGPTAALRADLDQRMASLRDFARRRHDDIARPPPGADALVREAAEFFTRGVSLYQRRQYQAALQAFEAALRYSQESQREVAELYYNLAVTHEHLGHRPEAAAAFREFLSRRPDTPERAAVEARVRTLDQ